MTSLSYVNPYRFTVFESAMAAIASGVLALMAVKTVTDTPGDSVVERNARSHFESRACGFESVD